MTDLDRQIAEIKGWSHVPAGTPPWIPGLSQTLPEGYEEDIPGQEGKWYHRAVDCCWSADDSKALELVDELCQDVPGNGWTLSLYQLPRMELGAIKQGKKWYAILENRGASIGVCGRNYPCKCQGEGATRPEAICRAYIAAVTWMRGRAK